jgi:hypothetical protein
MLGGRTNYLGHSGTGQIIEIKRNRKESSEKNEIKRTKKKRNEEK